MKRILCLIIVLTVALCAFCSCDSGGVIIGADDTTRDPSITDPPTQPIPVGFEAADFYFMAGDERLAPNDKVNDLTDRLGEPLSFEQTASCYGDGDDKLYSYDGFAVYTYPDGSDDYINIIELNSDKVATPKGARVSMTREQVTALYGNEFSEEGLVLEYKLDSGESLCFTVEDGIVTMIEYVM